MTIRLRFYYSVFCIQKNLGSGDRSHEFAIYSIRMSTFLLFFAIGWFLIHLAYPEPMGREVAKKVAYFLLGAAFILSLSAVRLIFGGHRVLVDQCEGLRVQGIEVSLRQKVLVTLVILTATFSPVLVAFMTIV